MPAKIPKSWKSVSLTLNVQTSDPVLMAVLAALKENGGLKNNIHHVIEPATSAIIDVEVQELFIPPKQ